MTKSLAAGHKLRLREINLDEELLPIHIVMYRFGKVAEMYRLASNLSEDFARLPTERSSSLPDGTMKERRKHTTNEYIEACLKSKSVIAATDDAFKAHSFDFSASSIRSRFGNAKIFRNSCAEISPEFAELLANAPKAIRK